MPAAYLKALGMSAGAIGRRAVCTKVVFPSRSIALKAARQKIWNLKTPKSEAVQVVQMGVGRLNAYKCRICEDAWHVGHKP
jgi:hypothetical protein